jgi:hypothetical protein
MKKLSIFGAFIFALLWVSTASAAIYTWTDENGVVHFTNYSPPPQAQVIVKDIPGKDRQGADSALEKSVEERLKRAEERADDLEEDLDRANEKAREALQRARAMEERIAYANRLAEETERIQQASYRYQETYEEGYAGYPYYGGVIYSGFPYRRPICRPYYRRHPRISHWKKEPWGRSHWRHKSWKGSPHYSNRPKGRHYGVIGINRARNQSDRIFKQSRSNPFRSSPVARRAIY